MKRIHSARLPLVAAMLVLLGACDDGGSLTGPDAPDANSLFAAGGGGKPSTGGGPSKPEPVKQIAFATEGANGRIHVINPDGTGYTAVPNTEGGTHPAWSPDRKKLAFAITSGAQAGIYVITTSGKQRTRLYTGAAGAPAWSPDGSRIAFHATINNTTQVLVMNANGGNLQHATATGTRNEDPAWSPTGDRLAFFSNRYNLPGIWVMNVTTGTRDRIAFCSQCGAPAWSPIQGDERIAFGEWGTASLDYVRVGIVPATGGIVRTILSEYGFALVTVRPSWSPDATFIVASTAHLSGNRELVMQHLSDQLDRRVITSTPAIEVAPAWAW